MYNTLKEIEAIRVENKLPKKHLCFLSKLQSCMDEIEHLKSELLQRQCNLDALLNLRADLLKSESLAQYLAMKPAHSETDKQQAAMQLLKSDQAFSASVTQRVNTIMDLVIKQFPVFRDRLNLRQIIQEGI